MYSREDVVKMLLAKKGVDPYATGGVRIHIEFVELCKNVESIIC